MMGERNPIQDDATCLNCGQALTYLQLLSQSRFCGAACCAWHSSLAPHEVCAGCGRRLSPHQFGERLCGKLECRRRLEERAKESESLRIETLRREAQRIRDRESGLLGVAQPDGYPLVIIPAMRRRLVPLDDARRQAFRNKLSSLVAEAVARLSLPSAEAVTPKAVDPVSPRSPTVSLVTDQACGLCRGSCCRNGGNHAYLTVETLRRTMIEHPELSSDDVLTYYLSHLSDETIEGSCIFHQADGCGLPRALRSDTCNRFYCPSLVEYRVAASSLDSARGFFAATAGLSIVAAAFIDESGARSVLEVNEIEEPGEPVA